jgi:putative ABC transport system permease protein
VRPDDRELDEEIRGHLALSVKERIERGEDPEAARLAALREFGYVPAHRDSMRRVWHSRWFEAAWALGRDIRLALRALLHARGLSATVVVTLALGIGANAAIFSVVRGVLLRPLVNRDEDRLIYIRQSGPGIGAENMTFSVPEIEDVKSRVTTISAFGDFSTVNFTMIGLSDEPRVVKAGVVNGSFFEVMGLRPVLGRLLNPQDDGAQAAGTAVLTHRFWTTSLNSDPAVIGKTVRLGPRAATVVGVLEPSVPYPADTEIIANVATSPHHLEATMVTSRTHRMTELFGRLAPGASLDAARAELTAVHAALRREHPEAYSAKADVQLSVRTLRDQIASPARTILLVLLAAAAVVFVIACSNVANLILARSVRREGELAVRAALGAGPGALRRTLLAESLVLCGAGAVLGLMLAQPLVAIVSRYAARFSVRALEVTVDPGMLWIATGLAMAAAVLLAYVPRLPSPHAPAGLGLTSGSVRITPGTNRRLRMFATTQIAFSFVLLAGAGMLLAALVSLQTAQTGYDMRQVLAFNIPTSATGLHDAKSIAFYQEATRRISRLPGVEGVAVGSFVPWRDAGSLGPGFLFTVDGYTPADGEENPRGRMRMVAPRFFAVLGVPLVAGRDFTDEDRLGSEPVTIISESVARRLFGGATGTERERVEVVKRGAGDPADPIGATGTERERVEVVRRGAGGPADPIGATGTERERVEVARRGAGDPADPINDAVNRHLTWTDPVFSIYGKPVPSRIVGVVADVDDENVVPGPALTIYRPAWQIGVGGRLFVRAGGDPYALVPAVTRVIREVSAEQPVERAATLEDVRAEVLSPDRLNAFVVSGFAGIALLIAVVGVAGVLAFSVSARTREFGVRLAVGSSPRHLLARVLGEGALIATIGIAVGAAAGYALASVAAVFVATVHLPGALPVLGAACVLVAAAVLASLMPAARASRVDVLQALRSE